MSFFKRLFGGRKESEAYSMIAQQVQGRAVMTPREYDKLAEEGYSKNAIAFRCVNLIASSTKSMRFVLYRKGKSKSAKITEIDSHPILELLDRPNPLMPGKKYWEHVAMYMQLSGNAYVHAPGVLESRKPPRELWPLMPNTVKVVPGRFAMPQAFEVSAGGQKKLYPVDPLGAPSQMLHIKTLNPLDPWYGMSPIEAAAFSIDQHNESGKWNVALLQNSARPSGAFIFKQSLRQDQREDVKRQLEEKYVGARNAGKPMVLEGDFDYKGFSFSPKDMEWIESKDTSARDIGVAFGVPSMLLNINGDNTYANYAEARQAFWIETVLPFVDDVLAYHNEWLPALFGDESLYLGYDKDELDALTPSRTELWTRVSNARFITTNEKRVATGYDERPEPEADEILVSSSDVPLTMEEPEPVDPNAAAALADENSVEGDEPGSEADADPSEDTEGKAELKVFNVRNAKERARVWSKSQRMRKSHERRFALQLSRALLSEGAVVADVVKGVNSADDAIGLAKHAIDGNREKLLRVIRENMRLVGKDFGDATLRAAKAEFESFETKGNIKFDSFLNNWIDTHSARRVQLVSDTTKRKIANAIKTAFSEEEGIPDLADRIAKSYRGFSEARATLIARTETVAASNAASLGAAKATGVPNLEKEWVSSNDDRSRDGDPETTDHRDMDGTRVSIDSKFDVWSADGSDHMDGPGDPSAPVDQIANCRCTLAFVQKGEA